MHLLFVTSLVPDGQPTTGYEIANAAVIDALRRAGVKVTVLGFTWPGKHPSDPDNTVVLGEVDVRNDTASPRMKIRWLIRALAMGLTISSVKLREVSEKRIRAAIAGIGPFDGYVLNGVTFPGAFEQLFNDRPQIFIAHNIEYRSARENADNAKSLVQKILFARESRLLERLERRLWARSSFIFTLAEEDNAALASADPAGVAALPLVTRPEPTAPQDIAPLHDLGLIGTWTWQPNRIGLEWFFREVVPHLDKDITISVAGSTPGDLKAAWPRINFVGRVEDATQFARQSAAIPLISRAGTGVQLKTIETFELGLPAVATTMSVRGIGTIPDNCIVADDPIAFAQALNAMVRRVRNGDSQRLDGRSFHASQLRHLDAVIRSSLDTLDDISDKRTSTAA